MSAAVARGAALIVAAWALGACDGGGAAKPADPLPDAEFVRRFHAGVVELEQHRFLDASRTFGELVAARPQNLGAWINLAQAQLNRNNEESYPLVEQAVNGALKIDPDEPHAHFIRGILHYHLGEPALAEARFRAAMKRAPDDPALLYRLATTLPEERAAEAIGLLERALEGQAHLKSAWYQIQILKGRGDREARKAALALFQAFEETETGNLAGIVYTEMGRLGEAWRDPGVPAPPQAAAIPAAAFEPPAPGPARARALAWTAPAETRPASMRIVPGATPTARVYPVDLDQDGVLETVTLDGGALTRDRGGVVGTIDAGGDVAACAFSDVDQDADVDVVAARRDGTTTVLLNLRDPEGGFAAYDPESWLGGRVKATLPKLPAAPEVLAAADLDGDADPDLVFAGPFGLRVWRNDRLMRFVDATSRAGLDGLPACRAFLLEDLNGDGALDVVALGVDGAPRVFVQVVRGLFTLSFAPAKGSLEPFAPVHALRVGDFDADGEDDLAVAAGDAAWIAPRGAARLARGLALEERLALPVARARGLMVGDLDGDLALDLVVSDADDRAFTVRAKPREAPRDLVVALQGAVEPKKMRANAGGVGARVECVFGTRARLREVRVADGMPGAGPLPVHFGLGGAGVADYVRIVWPDDVLQIEGAVPAGQAKVVAENQRKASSCPLVFVWDGTRYVFVTDFLGVGGLGFLTAPGEYAPPDPTERVLLPRIVPRDGTLDLVVHEPFEEVCYLDAARLLVVDHPADVEVIPDERFAIHAAQPDGKLFAVRSRLFPRAASDGRGRNVLREVLEVDRRYAEAHADPRFLGWAEPTAFVFDFGPALAADAREGWTLALDGWVEYPYSHVVLAASQRRLRLEAMSVDVEVEGAGFVAWMEEAAYPAGMPRTMTLPLPPLPEKATGRLRLRTNQELYIDRLSLFRHDDAAPLEVRALEARDAVLRASGYPREYSPDGAQPRLYDYDVMDKTLQFKTLAGAFTRFGDVAPLLGAADDRYVVFAGGEEIAFRFPAPPPPEAGSARTFVLDVVGWCKDMDPHTADPYTVEPLPFLKMSGYPYPADERFPDGPEHREWLERWQTRRLPGTRAGR
ncbi:MAG TPA: FG-GAP-like repeat-containing protein [Planctomycetota bacterium]|nr:FG-GAP-like repeat-containing protein [Planctomycetota bacterium]